MIILGINAYHPDASAALIVDGEVRAAVAEERFTRIKHAGGFPEHAVRWCLSQSPHKPDLVAVGRNPAYHRVRKVFSFFRYPRLITSATRKKLARQHIHHIANEIHAITGYPIPVRFVEHHRCHLAYAYATSPFSPCSVLSLDGFGDFVSAAWGEGSNGQLWIRKRIFFPHSIGISYTAVTQFLGFTRFGEEYKVMALAAYGKPRYSREIRQILRPTRHGFAVTPDAFEHTRRIVPLVADKEKVNLERLWRPEYFRPLLGKERARNEEITQRHMDIAASLQDAVEKIVVHMVTIALKQSGHHCLAIAGGVALNSAANGFLSRSGLCDKLWIGSAPADDGTAIGAAAAVVMEHGAFRAPNLHNATPFLGPFPSVQHPTIFSKANNWKPQKYASVDSIAEEVVRYLSQGRIIGWYEGRAEFGPRALGHRSILADPRNPGMRDRINAMVKKREWFRPFAPIVLERDSSTYFDMRYPSPTMMIVSPVRSEWKERFPAITHQDGTARVQTVNTQLLPNIARLLEIWKRHTGISVLLNTSFNENEPIVNTQEEALACAKRSGLDCVVALPAEGQNMVS